ncbi:MAG: hypothetical protein H0W33_07415 [Gammaproteobacteria bacterium]|nr:hypothetical protein [Gammaproteobacteria bacterium]
MKKKQSTWPALPYGDWQDTCATLHRWTQIVGKIRLARTPWHIHSWHATFYLTVRGLSTSPISYDGRLFQIDFDFIDHKLLIQMDSGSSREQPLRAQSVADFYATVLSLLAELNLHMTIHGSPNEVPDQIPFERDTTHAAYDPEAAHRFWRALLQADRVLKHFRTGFLGKSSPVHFFWGSFDLAVTRFSGRPAPRHPGGVPNLPDRVTREAYSHEVSSAGFWPGGGPTDYAAFYSYAYPTPDTFPSRPVQPGEAIYRKEAGEFLLPYEVVRTARDPDQVLLDFLQTTYEAAADAGEWNRKSLECPLGVEGEPRRANE